MILLAETLMKTNASTDREHGGISQNVLLLADLACEIYIACDAKNFRIGTGTRHVMYVACKGYYRLLGCLDAAQCEYYIKLTTHGTICYLHVMHDHRQTNHY